MNTRPVPAKPHSKKEWSGYEFTAYSLDGKKVWSLPLTSEHDADGKRETLPTTVGEIYEGLGDCRPQIEGWSDNLEITTGAGKATITGLAFHLDVLRTLVDLRADGVDPFAAYWFWYDSDTVNDMPQASYSFFVVHGDKIVREHVNFSDYDSHNYSRFGFDPSILVERDHSRSIWRNDDALEDARIRFWYSKFYEETRIGRLMVLRADNPRLFGGESHRRPEVAELLSRSFPVFLNLLGKIYFMLWILMALGALILIRAWK